MKKAESKIMNGISILPNAILSQFSRTFVDEAGEKMVTTVGIPNSNGVYQNHEVFFAGDVLKALETQNIESGDTVTVIGWKRMRTPKGEKQTDYTFASKTDEVTVPGVGNIQFGIHLVQKKADRHAEMLAKSENKENAIDVTMNSLSQDQINAIVRKALESQAA